MAKPGQNNSDSPASPVSRQQAYNERRRRWWLWYGVTGALIAVLFGSRAMIVSYARSQARESLASRQPRAALDWLKWCQRVDPSDPESEFLRARACRKLGEFNLLRDHLQRAFQLHYQVARLEREQVLAHAQAGQLAEAQPHLGELLRDPQGDEAEICEAFTNGFVLNRRYAEAFQLLTPWIGDFPRSPQPYYMRGHIQVKLQRFKPAEADLRKALELDPHHTAAAWQLADVLENLQRPREALPYYIQAARDPQFAMLAGVGRSRCLKILGKTPEARAVIRDVIEQYPGEPQPQLALGQIELEAGNYTDALKYLDQAALKIAWDRELRNARGNALRGLKRMDEAKREFEYVADAGRQLERANDLREKVQEKPDDYESRYEIGKIFLRYYEPREGVIWLQSVFNYVPDHQGAHAALAAYYQGRSAENREFASLAEHHRQAASQTTNDAKKKDATPVETKATD